MLPPAASLPLKAPGDGCGRWMSCLVGCLVLSHDVGADPAAFRDLQASGLGPGPHLAAIGPRAA